MVSVTIKRESSKILENLENGILRVGWFPSARYEDEDRTPVASVAAQNEYGNPSKRIPARPFIRPAIAHNENNWKDIGQRGLKAILKNKSTTRAVLENLGKRMVGDIQHSIAEVYSPPLSQKTVDARLERRNYKRRLNKTQARTITKPLIDTGHMQATVSYEISSES